MIKYFAKKTTFAKFSLKPFSTNGFREMKQGV
jgi:hypothetical protein